MSTVPGVVTREALDQAMGQATGATKTNGKGTTLADLSHSKDSLEPIMKALKALDERVVALTTQVVDLASVSAHHGPTIADVVAAIRELSGKVDEIPGGAQRETREVGLRVNNVIKLAEDLKSYLIEMNGQAPEKPPEPVKEKAKTEPAKEPAKEPVKEKEEPAKAPAETVPPETSSFAGKLQAAAQSAGAPSVLIQKVILSNIPESRSIPLKDFCLGIIKYLATNQKEVTEGQVIHVLLDAERIDMNDFNIIPKSTKP
jgi:flagellum-specific peptidoglycan hydrolase FlgJ